MANPDTTGRPLRVHRRYLLDRQSQLQFSLLVLLVVSGIGLLYAVAIYYLVDSDLVRGRSAGQVRTVLLLVHAAYFIVCGILLFATVLLLTHRFVGPAYVMQMAVEKMRRGDYSGRLSLRDRDFHTGLAGQLREWRAELVARDNARMEVFARLQRCMDDGNDAEARKLVAKLVVGHAAGRVQPEPGLGTRAVA